MTESSNRLAEQLNTLDTELIVAALNGSIDLNQVFRDQLNNRGLDRAGRWIGFDAARRLHAEAAT